MSVDTSKFTSVTPRNGGYVTFDDNKKGKIIGYGTIVSQLCDKGYKVIFDKDQCLVKSNEHEKALFVGTRHENIYTIDLDELLI